MGTAVANRPKSGEMSADQCLDLVKSNASRILSALPAGTSAEKFVQIFSVLVYKTPKLLRCDRESIITGIIHGSALGLDFTPNMNEAHLIPRWNYNISGYEAQFQPGYKGLEKLAINTGTLLYIQPREVRERDEFSIVHEYERTILHHKPTLRGNPGAITHVYAYAKLFNGDPIVEYMTADELEDIHKRSESYKYAVKERKEETGPWVADRKEMELKTVVKRMCKRLPRSTDPAWAKAFETLQTAIDADNRQYQIEDDGRREHHVDSFATNNTGHGSGRYAPDDQIAVFREWLVPFVKEKNRLWSEHWEAKPMEVRERAAARNYGRLLSEIQLSGHILKWGKALELISTPETPKNGQYDKLSAIAYDRDAAGVETEATAYARKKWAEESAKILMPGVPRPTAAPEPEDESQDADDVLDAAYGGAEDEWQEDRE